MQVITLLVMYLRNLILNLSFIKKSGWSIFLASCVSKWIEFETKKKVKKFEMLNSMGCKAIC